MQDFEKLGAFYLGQIYDMERRSRKEDLLLYDSRDLLTHAVCVGMTGSGKTGLCIGLIEEAAIDGVPAILIDPKGDLTQSPADFPELRAGRLSALDQLRRGARTRRTRRAVRRPAGVAVDGGLKDWGQDGARIRRMLDAAEFSIYTPRSSAGLPVSILHSFTPPPAAILEDAELRRERVQAAAGKHPGAHRAGNAVGTSREQTFVATIFDNAWREGKALDLEALIGAIQRPPFTRLGALDVNSFYPEKERFELATALNDLLRRRDSKHGSRAIRWISTGCLHTAGGQAARFDLHHRAPERPGAHVLRHAAAEPDGGLDPDAAGHQQLARPPVHGRDLRLLSAGRRTPAKEPLLTLLKQARAFGLGRRARDAEPRRPGLQRPRQRRNVVIGRLQTDRDKQRVLDGLEGAAAAAGRVSSARNGSPALGLGKRVFLMNNVHEKPPACFRRAGRFPICAGRSAATR